MLMVAPARPMKKALTAKVTALTLLTFTPLWVVENVDAGGCFEHLGQESGQVADIGHGFSVGSVADHDEAAGDDLAEKVVDIAAVSFAEDDGGADEDQGAVRGGGGPLPEHGLRPGVCCGRSR